MTVPFRDAADDEARIVIMDMAAIGADQARQVVTGRYLVRA